MEVRKYESKDYSQLFDWYNKRGLEHLPPKFLPPIGYIIDNYCASFLYTTESYICIIDNIISNPDTDKELRSKAIDKIHIALLEEAEKLGFKYIYVNTNIESIKNKWLDLGFKIKENNVYLYRGL